MSGRGYSPWRLILRGLRNVIQYLKPSSQNTTFYKVLSLYSPSEISQNPDELLNLLYECIEIGSRSGSIPNALLLLEAALKSQTYLPLALLLLKQVFKKDSIPALYQIASDHPSQQTAMNALWLSHQVLANSSHLPPPSACYSILIKSLLIFMKNPSSFVVEGLLLNLKVLLSLLQIKGPLKTIDYAKVFLTHQSLQCPYKKISFTKAEIKNCIESVIQKQSQILLMPDSVVHTVPSLLISTKLLPLYNFLGSTQDKLCFLSLFSHCELLPLNEFLYTSHIDQNEPVVMKNKLAIIRKNIMSQPFKFFSEDYFPFLDQNKENQNLIVTDFILELKNVHFPDQHYDHQVLLFLLERHDYESKRGNSQLAEKISEAVEFKQFTISTFRELMLSDPINFAILRSSFGFLLQFETQEMSDLNQICFSVLDRLFIQTQEGIESRTFHKLTHLIFPLILQSQSATPQDFKILQSIVTKVIYHINDVSNAYMLKKEKEKAKSAPKFSVLGIVQDQDRKGQTQELDALSDILLSKTQTISKVLNLLVLLAPYEALEFFPKLIVQFQKESIESKILKDLKGSIAFAQGIMIHQDLLDAFFSRLSSLFLQVNPSKLSCSVLQKALGLRFDFQNSSVSPTQNNERRQHLIGHMLNKFDLHSDRISFIVVTAFFLHQAKASNIILSYYNTASTHFFYMQCLALLLLPLQGTLKSYRTTEKHHMERVLNFFQTEDICKLKNLGISLTNEEISQVLALLLTYFKEDEFLDKQQSASISSQNSLIKVIYYLLFSRNLAYKNGKVKKNYEKEINVQRTLLKSLQDQVLSIQKTTQSLQTLTYFISSKKQDSYGSIYDQLLFDLAFNLLQRVEKDSKQYYLEYEAFLIQTVLPLIEEGPDLWEARFIQLLLNITNAVIPESVSNLGHEDFYIEKLPSCLLKLLKEDLSYPPFKQHLVHMTCVITLTNIVRSYRGQALSFCNSLFDCIYEMIENSPEFVKSAGVKCIVLMVESIKGFMSGRMVQILRTIISSQDNQGLLRAVVHNVPLRSSIKPLIKIYQQIEVKKEKSNVVSEFKNYCKLLTYLMRYSKDKEVLEVSKKMTALFLILLGFCGEMKDEADQSNTEIQDSVNEAIVQFFLKHKEGELTEIMQQFVEEEKKSQNLEYSLSFYSLLIKTLDTLHHFAVPYFLKVFERVNQLLNTQVQKAVSKVKARKHKDIQQDFSGTPNKTQATLGLILNLIQKSYKSDSKGAISILCFEMLSEPLSLLYRAKNLPDYGGLSRGSLNPCIVQMFDSFDDLDKQRELLNAILLSLREPLKTGNKIAIAELIFQLLQTIGDRFLPHLKDTVPFLTELMEDKNEQVVQAAQKSVYKIEAMTGESMKDYI